MRNVSKMLARGAAGVAGAALLLGGAVGCEDPDPESNALVEELQEKPGEPVVEDKEAAPGINIKEEGAQLPGNPIEEEAPGSLTNDINQEDEDKKLDAEATEDPPE